MKLVTGEAMARIDGRAIDGRGIPGLSLMERAGEGVVAAIHEAWGELRGASVGVVCGRGNNGGDGLVIGRLMAQRAAHVVCYLLSPPDELRGDAMVNYKRAVESGLDLKTATDEIQLDAHGLIVDAVFGTGFKGSARDLPAHAIEKMNSARAPIVAVDVPSGVSADDGSAAGPAVRAALTVTMAFPKVGHVRHPGRECSGAVAVVDIGVPADCVEGADAAAEVLTEDEAAALLPKHEIDAHKGDFGRAFLLAGSEGLTGAAALAAEACARSGAGLVFVGCPASLNDVLEAKLTEPMTRPLPENRKHRALSRLAFSPALAHLRGCDAAAIGPGLSTYHQVRDLVRQLVPNLPRPTVIDADGLNALVGAVDVLSRSPSPVVITPHPGEFARLFDADAPSTKADPIGAARSASKRTRAVVALKGAPTVICSADGGAFVNPTGNAGMATGGTGDVLTGLIVGLMAQGMGAFDAAVLACYVHGAAGDFAASRLGRHAMLAGDLLHCVPDMLRHLSRHRARERVSFLAPFDVASFRELHPVLAGR